MLSAVESGDAACDVFVSVAAVADFRVANVSAEKIKKTADGALPPLQWEQNPDILHTVSHWPSERRPFCVGFAAESTNLIEYATAKRQRKNVELLCGNIGPATFGSDDNTIILFDEKGHETLPTGPKLMLARRIVAQIGDRLS
jgi:phosphopantothenoylcysteine decarboxylase/phosphopantothenate--cysteine ligase